MEKNRDALIITSAPVTQKNKPSINTIANLL